MFLTQQLKLWVDFSFWLAVDSFSLREVAVQERSSVVDSLALLPWVNTSFSA
jgi:hypothetical protein